MNTRQKHICDHIMHSITSAEGQKKFGLSGLATLFDGKATDTEVVEAVQYLLDNNYLRRMQGRGVTGIGDSDELKTYDLQSFDPFSTLPAKDRTPESMGTADGYKGNQKSAKQPSLSELQGKSKPAAEVDEESQQPAVAESVEEAELAKPEKGLLEREHERQQRLNIENIPTLFGIKDQARKEGSSDGVFDAIDQLKKQLKPERVPNVALKLAVLSELTALLDPSISHVLKDIQADYRNRSI